MVNHEIPCWLNSMADLPNRGQYADVQGTERGLEVEMGQIGDWSHCEMCDGFETREQTRLGVLWHSEGRHKSALLSQVPAPPPLLILTWSAVLLTQMFDGKERNKFWSEIADPSTPRTCRTDWHRWAAIQRPGTNKLLDSEYHSGAPGCQCVYFFETPRTQINLVPRVVRVPSLPLMMNSVHRADAPPLERHVLLILIAFYVNQRLCVGRYP